MYPSAIDSPFGPAIVPLDPFLEVSLSGEGSDQSQKAKRQKSVHEFVSFNGSGFTECHSSIYSLSGSPEYGSDSLPFPDAHGGEAVFGVLLFHDIYERGEDSYA